MIKAIETRYKGYRFRSRLEARWAVFFDALDVPWEYEKEGYDLGEAGWYLPDFWIVPNQLWVEIKPNGLDENATQDAMTKAGHLAAQSGERVLLCSGLPDDGSTVIFETLHDGSPTKLQPLKGMTVFFTGYLALCPGCGTFSLATTMGTSNDADLLVLCPNRCAAFDAPVPKKRSEELNRRMEIATSAARAARFEHGERGR